MPLTAGTEGKGTGGNCRLAPILAMAGAGLPWIAYDMLIPEPSDFWTFRGAVFMAIVLSGIFMVIIAWLWSHGRIGSKKDIPGAGC